MIAGERRQEDREQEEDAGDDRGEAGPAALGDARRALDVGRVRADAGGAADDGRDAVDEQDAARRPGTDPSSLARPASDATPVTVPIVSKKSVSMIAKMVSTAASGPRTVKTLVRSNWPSVAKLGVDRERRTASSRRRGSARRS